ncbi:glyoxalase [Deinococcus misasensis]|uniref:glyoxalase n=1 Tax=Deinococcus misasensis TaxID=392413 RepID=UPI0005574A6A|nr:glyoxalase [Deinococcus misasensis]
MLTGLDHVLVPIPEGKEDTARAFYGSFLGLQELAKPAPLRARGGVWFALPDGRQLHLGVEKPFVPQKKAHPCFRTLDLRQVMEHFDRQGVAYVQDHTLDVARIFTSDPWGNRLEIVQGEHKSILPLEKTHP